MRDIQSFAVLGTIRAHGKYQIRLVEYTKETFITTVFRQGVVCMDVRMRCAKEEET